MQTAGAQQFAPADPVPTMGMCSVAPIQFSSSQLMPPGHVKVESRRTEIVENKVALFSGDVGITSDRATIRADQAQVSDNGRNLIAKGDVTYQDAQLKVDSDSVAINSNDQRLRMKNTRYQLTGFSGQGAANEILLASDEGVRLSDVSFTTCPQGDEDWIIRASEISIEKGTVWGQAKHTRFYVGDVPVFYLPYFAFPVSDQRQTGFLTPVITSSSYTGIDVEQPFYWNIAPNYDMTIAPRVMTNRGVQLKTEFRYLTRNNRGQLNLEYLPSDSDIASSPDRYFYHFEHEGVLSENWLLGVDFNGISDDNYIVDLGSDFYNRADTHLYRSVNLNYYEENLLLSMRIRDFEVIGDHPNTYRALPELQLNYTQPLGSLFEFRFDSELAYFDNTQESAPTATRFHVAPTLAIPYQRQWGELTAEATLLNTYYHQQNTENTPLEEEVNRTLGQARLFGALYFERDTTWISDAMTMTLEPKFQYLYTSYEDQTNIGMYDSTPLLTDTEGLFRGQEFTGLDRISDNNEVTIGVTTRILDETNREQFVLSLGQIFYLDDSQLSEASRSNDRSALAGEVDWRLEQRWYLHSEALVSTDTDKVERSSISLEYRHDAQRFIQLTHRYVRELSGETIDQIGVSASWPIAKNWQWVGRTYRDLERERSIESYVGIEYESCCWAIRVVAQRHLNNRFNALGEQSVDDYDSGIALQFLFKGFGNSGNSRTMLRDGMFGYRQPYTLN
ncbi:LPS-assembly protein LptD [Alteromonas halophila]|uniref:LPS-assembly protein LptD n=2 Tax=Alteromonas halophila TaxID=516698 RepID=A0A918JIA6_9ALTE|nr:LPS-assembly protein LptD [Alteromonas halophila]